MPQPTPYERFASFTSLQRADPTGVTPGTSLDVEFNSVKQTLDETLSNLALIQRDDGALRNGIVTQYSLSPSLSLGFTFRGAWGTGVAYAVADGVSRGSRFYICRVAHTSASGNAPDLDSVTWELSADLTSAVLDAVNAMNLDVFSGDNSQTVFTLTSSPAAEQNMLVSVGGVLQSTSEYTVSSGVLTFSEAPPLGTDNIEVRSFSIVSVSGNIPASLVQMSPTVAGGSTVQAALQNVDADVTSAAAVASAASATASNAVSSAAAAVVTANTANATAESALTQATSGSVSGARLDNGTVAFGKFSGDAIATSTDATAGTSNSKVMTPYRVAQAIAAMTTSSATAGRLLAVTRFKTSGTWSKATHNPSFIVVKVVGGGGGGGSVTGGGMQKVGSGGGSGGYSEKKILSASLGATETVSVGAGGVTNSAGGTSSFGSHCSATGGGAGVQGTVNQGMTTGAAGGVGVNGDLNLSGNPGGNGYTTGSPENAIGGAGGVGPMGCGGGRAGYDHAYGAVDPTAGGANTGAGGGGAATRNSTGRSGAAGGSGYVEVLEFS